MNEVLTAETVLRLHEVLDACEKHLKVKWEADDDLEVREGVARRVSKFNGTDHVDDEDVRHQFLHISGFVETWIPMEEVLRLRRAGAMAFHHRPGV